MSNHYHLLISTPDCNLSKAMEYFLREVSRDLNRNGNRINRTFAGRFYVTYLGEANYFLNTYKYVYQNPLRANICNNAEDYEFSTLAGLLGKEQLQIPVEDDTILFDDGDIEDVLSWVNELPSGEDLEAMRRALRRGEFSLPSSKNRRHRLEDEKL